MAISKKEPQSRKWLLTINNPLDHDCGHDKISQIIGEWDAVKYYCMGDEKGENGTYHVHVFIYSPSGIRFSTVKNNFPTAHIDKCQGTAQENRDYCFKDGEKFNKDENGNYDYTDASGKRHTGTHYDNTNIFKNQFSKSRPQAPKPRESKRVPANNLPWIIQNTYSPVKPYVQKKGEKPPLR